MGKHHCLLIRWRKCSMVKEQNSNFISNGSLLQEELISFCNGKNLPIQVFSTKEVMKMSDFSPNQMFEENSTFQWYKGNIEKRSVSIKRFHSLFEYVGMKGIIREIVIATEMSMNSNTLRLLGCCLETQFPTLIYEFPENGCLAHRINNSSNQHLPWRIRLRIGYEISYALSYLQNGFKRPIIYRNLSTRDVFLDKDYRAKLTGFYMSVIIPEGKLHVMDALVGTTGWSAPEYCRSGKLTEKSDVYMFGIFLLNLTRIRPLFCIDELRDCYRYGRTNMILDPEMLREGEDNGLAMQQEQEQVMDLVFRCTSYEEDDRPNMVDVASELKLILCSC